MSGTPYRTVVLSALCVAILALVVVVRMAAVTDTLRKECSLCAAAAADFAPYVEAVRGYEKAKAMLGRGGLHPPSPRLGLPPAKISSERAERAVDGWMPWVVTYSWDKLETGQAFAALDSFTSQDASRIYELRLDASQDGVSLKVTLTGAYSAAGDE